MKIDFGGVTRVLDLEGVKLQHAIAIQRYTGLPLVDWLRSFIARDQVTKEDAASPARVMSKMTMLTDTGWIVNIAAAHWLMLAQNGEDPPPLDDEYDCDVLTFGKALMTVAVEEMKAAVTAAVKPGPTVPPGRGAPSSRRTATRKPKTATGGVLPPPPTGS